MPPTEVAEKAIKCVKQRSKTKAKVWRERRELSQADTNKNERECLAECCIKDIFLLGLRMSDESAGHSRGRMGRTIMKSIADKMQVKRKTIENNVKENCVGIQIEIKGNDKGKLGEKSSNEKRKEEGRNVGERERWKKGRQGK